MHKKKSGLSMIQVLVAVTMLGLLSFVVHNVMSQINTGFSRSKEAAAILELRNQATPILKDHERWLTAMRLSSPTLASCIPATGPSSSCPTFSGAIDSDVLALYPGKTITPQALVDLLGNPLAGDSTPVLLNSDGALCTTSNCTYEVRGFFIRENASGNPGDVSFAYKITKLASNTGSAPMKPVIAKIDIGMGWRAVGIGSVAINCTAPNTYLKGISAGGVPNCQPLPSAATPLPSCNPVTEYLGSNASGQPVCKRFVSTNCADDEHITTNSSGNLVCKKDQAGCTFPNKWSCSCRLTTNGGIHGYVVFCVHCTENNVINRVWAGPLEITSSSVGCPASVNPPGGDGVAEYNTSSD